MKPVRRLGGAIGRFGNPVSGLTVFVVLVAVVTTRRLAALCSEADRGGYDVVPDDDRAAPVTVRGLLGELIEHALSPGPADWPANAEA